MRTRGHKATSTPSPGKRKLMANAQPAVGAQPPKTKSITPQIAAEMRMRRRMNPIRGLDFETLVRQIESFNAGHLAEFALTAEELANRDDVLKCVAPKRKKAASRNGYKILPVDDSPEAAAHAKALDYFYTNCRVVNAVDLNERGGIKLLFRQMMDAVLKKYAVHEIVWVAGGEGYTAEFRFVPLWHFENTRGELRFLPQGYGIEGLPLEEGGWLVTVGEGVMTACSIAWMFKNLPLKDWAIYCNRHGMPGIKGLTDAQRGTPEFEAMVDAVEQYASEYAVVMSNGESIESIDTKGQGDLPYPAMVERSDRALARLLRGNDLGTMSKDGDAVGSNPQEKETETLEEDDAEMLTEALQQYVDRWVIEYTFGRGVAPKAYIQVNSRNDQDVKLDLEIDKFLLPLGLLGKTTTLQRYQRELPEGDGEILSPAHGAATESPEKTIGNVRLANERTLDAATLLLIENARPLLGQAMEEELGPFTHRVAAILRIENEESALRAVRALRADLPLLLRGMSRNPKAEALFYQTFGAAALNGWARGESQRLPGLGLNQKDTEARK